MADPYGLSIADTMKKRAAQGIDVRGVVDELNNVLNSSKKPELKPAETFVEELVERLFEKDFSNSQEMTKPLDISWTYGIISSLSSQL